MGGGASKGVQAGVEAASAAELRAAVGGLASAEKAKLADALQASGVPGAAPVTVPTSITAGVKHEKRPPPEMPDGSAVAVPVVDVDGFCMGQCPAILAALGSMFQLSGKTPQEKMRCLQALQDMNDVFGEHGKMAEATKSLRSVLIIVCLPHDGLGSSAAKSAETVKLLHGRSSAAKSAETAEVYSAVEPVVLGALRGHSGAVLCYGQTSAGKTFTMEGPPMDKEAWGIIPRALDTLLSAAAAPAPGAAPRLRLSMLEIYMEQLRDLLDPANGAELHITTDRSGEVCVRGLREVEVQSLRDALEVFEFGRAHRAVAATGMNDRSSRSHCVVMVKVDAGPPGSAGAPPRRAAKLCLADLAGSECLKKTWRGPGPACSQVVEEARAVNQSLTALGLVVRRLAACRRGPAAEPAHVPYRSSKLTRALQDNSPMMFLFCDLRPRAARAAVTVALVVNCSLSRLQTSETLSTLRFGTCARVAIGRSGDAGEERRQLLLQTLRAAREQLAALVAAQASGWPRDAPAALRGGSSSPGSRSRSLSPLELSPP
ncbi:unnamed protein product, partial [Prorocentrum cordatum]